MVCLKKTVEKQTSNIVRSVSREASDGTYTTGVKTNFPMNGKPNYEVIGKGPIADFSDPSWKCRDDD